MTSLDFLYIALGVGFLLLAVFGSIATFYVIFILRDTTKIVDNIRDVTDRINDLLVAPIKVVNAILEKVKPIYDSVHDKKEELEKKIRKKKS